MDSELHAGLTGGASTAHVEFGVEVAAIADFSVTSPDIVSVVLFGVHLVARDLDFLATTAFGITFTGVSLSVETATDSVQTPAVSVRLWTNDAEEIDIVSSADGGFSADVVFFTSADVVSVAMMSHPPVVPGAAGVISVALDSDGVRRTADVSGFAGVVGVTGVDVAVLRNSGVVGVTGVDVAVLRNSSMRFINSSVSSVGK